MRGLSNIKSYIDQIPKNSGIHPWDKYQRTWTPMVRLAVCLVPHYGDVIMGAIASQITSLTIVYSTFYSDADQRKHQSSASLAYVWGTHRRPVNSPHKWPVTRKTFPIDDVIMKILLEPIPTYFHLTQKQILGEIWIKIAFLQEKCI